MKKLKQPLQLCVVVLNYLKDTSPYQMQIQTLKRPLFNRLMGRLNEKIETAKRLGKDIDAISWLICSSLDRC